MRRWVLLTGFAINAFFAVVGFLLTGKLSPIATIPATVLIWIAAAIKEERK